MTLCFCVDVVDIVFMCCCYWREKRLKTFKNTWKFQKKEEHSTRQQRAWQKIWELLVESIGEVGEAGVGELVVVEEDCCEAPVENESLRKALHTRLSHLVTAVVI